MAQAQMGVLGDDFPGDSAVFSGIPLADREALVSELCSHVCSCSKGEAFRHAGDVLDCYPVVISGRVRATMPQGGQDRIVATFGPGESFAEAVPRTLKRCPVDIWAVEDTTVLCIPASELDSCKNPWAVTLRANLTGELSKKVGVLSQTLAVLSEPRLSDRILAHLETLPHNADGSITVPYGRSEWAGVLRVADKSLIRELRSMQEAGVLEVDGRTIRILGRQ